MIKASKGMMHGLLRFFEALAILKHTAPAKAGGAERVPPAHSATIRSFCFTKWLLAHV